MRRRINTACCTDLEWSLLEILVKHFDQAQDEEQVGGRKKKNAKKEKKSMPFNNIYPIFAKTMPEAVKVACLRALVQKDIELKGVTAYCKGFQGKALIANTIVDHLK
jgi:hypothetical protein